MKATSRRLPPEREAELSELAEAVRGYGSGLVDPLGIARSERITTSFGDYADAFDGLLECGRARWLMESRPRWLVSTGAVRGPRASA